MVKIWIYPILPLRSDGYYRKCCNDCRKTHMQNYYIKNKEKLDLNNKIYYSNNKDKKKEYEEKNKERFKNRKKLNRIKNRKQRNLRRKLNRETNFIYKLKHNMRSLISYSIKNKGYKKCKRTQEILGCSFEFFKQYLEQQFQFWMSWENHGKYNGELNFGWDLDHIVPISSAKTEEEVYKLNHYSNFQPLCSKVNRDIKKDKLFYEK